MLRCPTAVRTLRNLMEVQSQQKVHFHYNHTDSCNFSRWTARECYEFMYARPWHKVVDFYADMVKGHTSLSELFGKERPAGHEDAEIREDHEKSEFVSFPVKERGGRWARINFKIVLSYHGGSFDGWQKQPDMNTVQGLIERSLGEFVDEKKAQLLKDKNLPLEGCAVVAGRTDKGVSASQQVCSFYTWRKDVKIEDVKDALDKAAPGKIRVVSLTKVSREFHPNFSAKWRRYLYIFPIDDVLGEKQGGQIWIDGCTDVHQQNECGKSAVDESNGNLTDDDNDELVHGNKPIKFEVSKVNRLLGQLEGKLLSYKMFARDTKASRNNGPPTECFVFHARAIETSIPCAQDGSHMKAMCIELVANRFLRKMVRVLVATVIREAAAGAGDDALRKLMDATCRRATAPPAPSDGLCLVDVGYTDYDRSLCLIP
ncbi:tRNA putativeuridine synthase A isoform X1 [Capsicum annuum]|uniref:tRNA pseudouridine synthase A isoform X1 n=1 Tax=Capsicum annuum TaxID=4072 RepID=UPI001FB1919F|nr:tRNA pseudouridine synthase A isoform X1 [Capsicum annuum]XP_047249770.1 tRNA pseudouridine synthase A isoform X1 [Capsicum annuum]XP_047249771.1 tRNA pseudouridine synthase A isoform X1 [Capsicum annuum]